MNTKSEIIKLADALVRTKGYNAFSFSDISKKLNIKNASIHYHFPSKSKLGVAIVHEHMSRLNQLIKQTEAKEPLVKLNAFLSIYSTAKTANQICLVGSLATDLYTVDKGMQKELKLLVNNILEWVILILEEGKNKKVFHFAIAPRMKALMIITNMLAAVQLTRLTNNEDFEQIKQTIINDLTTKRK